METLEAIGQHVTDVKGEITPYVALRWRDLAFCSKAQLK